MILTNVKIFFCRSDVRIMIFGTATGALLQILCKRYLKNHPELLNNSANSKEIIPRGGEIVIGSALAQALLAFLAEHGLTAGLLSSVTVVIGRIPVTTIAKYLGDVTPHRFLHSESKRGNMVDEEKIDLGQFDQNMKYIFKMLQDENIPFEERKKIAYSGLTKYLNLKTEFGRHNFIFCIILILQIFSVNHNSSFYIMMKNLIKAIKEGRISKAVGRLIVRRLEKKGITIDPELTDVVAF